MLAGLCGVLLILNPFAGSRVLATFLGISLMADGLLNICITANTVKAVDKKKHIEADYEIRD